MGPVESGVPANSKGDLSETDKKKLLDEYPGKSPDWVEPVSIIWILSEAEHAGTYRAAWRALRRLDFSSKTLKSSLQNC